MQVKTFLLFVIVFFALCQGCSNSTTPDETNGSTIRGKVIDRNGSPVKDALIEISYKANLSPYSYSWEKNKNTTEVTIYFQIPRADSVKLVITQSNPDKIVRTLLNDFLQAGRYSVLWDGKSNEAKYVVSGVYESEFQTSDTHTAKSIVYLREYDNISSIDSLEYFARTDDKGEYFIDQTTLPFGFSYLATNASGDTIFNAQISRYIKLWALHESYNPVSIDSLHIDEINGARVILQFD